MFSAAAAATINARMSEPLVFVPLEAGVAPFPLKRAVLHATTQFAKPTYGIDGEQEDDTYLSNRSVPRFAAAASRLSNVFRRRRIVSAPTSIDTTEPAWFTSPDNWRPGLLSLEQAARRADIVRRPEAFEQV